MKTIALLCVGIVVMGTLAAVYGYLAYCILAALWQVLRVIIKRHAAGASAWNGKRRFSGCARHNLS